MIDEKTRFAESLLANPGEPFKAALEAFPNDPGKALQIANVWATDPDVLAISKELKAKLGEKAFMPTKEAIAREVLDIGRSILHETKDRLNAYKLASEILGYIEKPSTNIQTNVTTQSRIMVIRDHGSNEDWETKAKEQQKKLLENAGTKH